MLSVLLSLIFSVHGAWLSVNAGSVGNRTVTSREVIASGLIDRWLLTRGVTKVNSGDILVQDSAAYKKQLSQVLAEWVVVLEADAFSVANLNEGEARKLAESIQKVYANWSEWKKLDLSITEIETFVTRRLRARQYLKYKTESIGAAIPESEVKQYYDKNRVLFAQIPYENIKDSIREHLNQVQSEDRFRDWFDVLKRKYKVKVLPTPSKPNDRKS